MRRNQTDSSIRKPYKEHGHIQYWGTVKNINRLEMVELVFPLPVLPIVEAGTYALEVLAKEPFWGHGGSPEST